jgi:hypothetical protein
MGEVPTGLMAEVDERQAFSMAEQIADMKHLVETEQESRAAIEHFVEASRDRERRLLKAIAALEGVPLGAGGRPKTTPKPAPSGKVSEGNITKVLDAMRAAGGPLNRSQISDQAGVHSTTAGYAIQELRARGLIRNAGKDQTADSPRKPDLFAVMPDAT